MPESLTNFINQHQLPEKYLLMADHEFKTLLDRISNLTKKSANTIFVGINGCQGSGKTTLADYLVLQLTKKSNIKAISCSIDDFYLAKNDRNKLASSIHPLLKTRGVPGTHNIQLLEQTLNNFSEQKTHWRLTQFDKATDNPKPEKQWPMINTKMDVVIIEGWCWGIPAQLANELNSPINEFELKYDKAAKWRTYANQQLKNNYQKSHNMMDIMVMLKAPSFNCVYQWRLEQEQKLASSTKNKQNTLMSEQDIAFFIQHFQRLTEHALKVLPAQVDFLFELDKNRQITNRSIKAKKIN